MARTIKKTDSTTQVVVNGKSVYRTVYIVDDKRCFAKYKNSNNVRQKTYVPIKTDAKPMPKKETKQKGGGNSQSDWKNSEGRDDFSEWSYNALEAESRNQNSKYKNRPDFLQELSRKKWGIQKSPPVQILANSGNSYPRMT
jgi:hypothetical protein